MDYVKLYDQMMELHREIHNKVEFGSVREVQALGATYTLIDYLANRIGEIGEPPEGEDL